MANTLKLGNGKWATGKDTVLAFNDENNNFKPLPFSFSRDTMATVINKEGLIETVGSGEPRIDFKNNTKGALLLEPERMNNLVQSNQFDTTWSLSSSISLTSGQSGVGGSTDAWLLKKTDASSRYINQSITLSSSTYSYSVFAKKESGNWLYVRLADSGGSLASTSYFDLENGVVGSTSANSLSIQSYNNGWYRCEIKFTHSIGNVRMYPAVSDGSPSGGSGGEGVYIYGAQLEQGSYATSYIPTSGSAVTRSAESTSQTPPDGVIGQTEGTVFLDTKMALQNINNYQLFSINNGGGSDRIRILTATGNRLRFIYQLDGGILAYSFYNPIDYGSLTSLKIAFTYKSGDIKVYINGVLVDSSTNTFTIAEKLINIDIASSAGGYSQMFFKDAKLYNTVLTDAELQALTQ